MTIQIRADHSPRDGYKGQIVFDGRVVYETPPGAATSAYDGMVKASSHMADVLKRLLADPVEGSPEMD